MRNSWSLAAAAATLVVSACGGHATYVKSETALGRVVVYRNGIAFYERRAKVVDGKVTLNVPHDKVNDFLKSLTVADAKTGESLPVSYPTRGASHGNDVNMTVQVPKTASREVLLTYLTEAPAWKPTYRVVVEPGGQVALQGWAIVDNTSGEDWKKVRVGVGSSSAMAFRYDLRTVRNIHRETLRTKERFAVAPPRGGATHGPSTDGEALVELADKDIPLPAGHPGSVYNQPAPEPADMDDAEELTVARADRAGDSRRTATKRRARYKRRKAGKAYKSLGGFGGGGSGGGRGSGGVGYAAKGAAQIPMTPPPPPKVAEFKALREQQRRAESNVAQLAVKLNRKKGQLVIEGFAEKREAGAKQKALARANALRNELIRRGVDPGRLKVVSKGHVHGHRGGVRIVSAASKPDADGHGGATASASPQDQQPVGESHFESEAKLTVERGTSAMVSILKAKARGDVVYLYDAISDRGSQRFAFKSLLFQNPTESTLETGPVTVYGKGRFVGEGLTEPVPPGANAIVPFALDRQVVIDRDGSFEDRISKLVTLQRGVLTAEVQHTRKTKLKIVNRLHKPATVFVRHARRKGWKVIDSPEVFEKLGLAYLFRVQVPPGKSETVEIHEATPLTRTIDLRSDVGVELVRVYLRTPRDADESFAEAMQKLLKIHNKAENHRQTIDNLRERMGEYRARMEELHIQLVSLREAKLKSGGSLLKHLQKKLKEMSEAVQKATIAVVDHQQKLMMERIRFQDGVAELSLEKTAKKVTRASARSAKRATRVK